MKIVVFNTLYYPYQIGGAEKSVKTLSEEFFNLGNEVLVITLGEKDNFLSFNGVQIQVYKLENNYWPYNKKESKDKKIIEKLQWHIKDISNKKYNNNLINILNSFKPDIIFTNNLSGFSTHVWNIAKNLNIKIVHTLRDYYLQCPKTTKFKNGKNCTNICLDCKLLSRIKKKNSHNISFLIGISNYILEDHKSKGFFSEIPQKVIYNGFKTISNNVNYKKRALENITFGFIGQLNQTKGIELILKSFSLLKKPNWKLLIAGSANDHYISELRAIHDSENITFLGYTESSIFFEAIDVLIAPSIWNEPFGRVVVESIFNRKPVIGSSKGGIPELLSNNPSFIIEPTVDNLVKLIKKIINNPEFLNKFIFDETFNNKFLISEVAKEYLSVFRSLISK